MELRTLLMLLLISNICPGQTQERLKAVVKTERDIHETITVRCELPGDADDWTYSWFIDGSSRPLSIGRAFSFIPDEDIFQRLISVTCGGERSDGLKSEISDAVALALSIPEGPKAVLTVVQPEPSLILRGETVTLTCDILGEGWTYSWRCGDTQHDTDEKEFKMTAEITLECVCNGCIGSFCSDWSDEVTLTVSDRPRVTVKPQRSVFTGDTVTLRCDVRRSSGRRIIWYKDFKRIHSGVIVKLSDVRVSDGGEYWCVLGETQGPRVTLTVRERPKAVLRVQPDGRVSRGQTVTLTCDIQETDGTSWTYSWNKDRSKIRVSQSQEYRISSVNESHTGHYSCRGRETGGSRYTHTSDEVTLTLSVPRPLLSVTPMVSERPKAVLRVQPDGRVSRGQTVTLTCDIQETDGTSWTYSWNKDRSQIHVSQSQEYRISSVNESHTGHYSCRGRETGGSRYTHTSDEVTLTLSDSDAPLPVLSVLKLLSFLLAASPYLLVTIIIGVKYYRAHAQSDEINQFAVTEE